MSGSGNELWVANLGVLDYDDALALQQRLHRARVDQLVPDLLLLLEHPPVYTRGRRSDQSELPMPTEWYRERGIEIRDVDRGGKVTYHGPGQLVGYPIVSTELFGRDVTKLVGSIEQALVRALFDEGVDAHTDATAHGVWAGDAKIASIGLHISGNVTTHGFMVNVDNDLTPFEWINACGLGTSTTSIAEVTGRQGRMRCFRKRAAHQLAINFGLRQRIVSRARLEQKLDDLVLAL